MYTSDKSTGQIMTKKLITVNETDTLLTAYECMQEKKIRHLPVTNSNGKIVGILSDRDIQRAMTPFLDPSSSTDSISFELDPAFKVKDFMSWPIRTIEQHRPVIEVARELMQNKVSALLIVGHDAHPKGIITTDDLIKLLITILEKPDEPASKLLIEGFISTYGNNLGYLD
jgi:acetoin utilization protein AcuB